MVKRLLTLSLNSIKPQPQLLKLLRQQKQQQREQHPLLIQHQPQQREPQQKEQHPPLIQHQPQQREPQQREQHPLLIQHHHHQQQQQRKQPLLLQINRLLGSSRLELNRNRIYFRPEIVERIFYHSCSFGIQYFINMI